MCVLIIKGAGKKMPNYNVIRAAWLQNPDGGGFATPTKSFHSLDFFEFYKELRKVRTNEPCIIHLRWATHGSVKVENCHPFFDNCGGGTWFAHNGILDIKPIGDMTDSETAFKTRFAKVIEEKGIDSTELDEAVWDIIGFSKFAFLNGNKVKCYGHYIEGENGCLFSNRHFERYLNFALPKRRYNLCAM